MVKVVVILQGGHLYHCDEGGGDLAFNLACLTFLLFNMVKVVVILHAKRKMFNIFLLGLCFCFVFTGFNTLSQTQVIVMIENRMNVMIILRTMINH